MEVAEKEIEARESAATNEETSNTQMKRLSSNRDRPTAAALVVVLSELLLLWRTALISSCKSVKNPEARKQILLKAGRCFVCLKKGHVSRDCKSSLKCTNCRGRHHVTICNGSRRISPPASAPSPSSHQAQQPRTATLAVTQSGSNNSTLSMDVDAHTPVLLQTATTVVYSKNRPAVPMKARLILDSGSQKSYISADLRNELKLPSEQSVTLSI